MPNDRGGQPKVTEVVVVGDPASFFFDHGKTSAQPPNLPRMVLRSFTVVAGLALGTGGYNFQVEATRHDGPSYRTVPWLPIYRYGTGLAQDYTTREPDKARLKWHCISFK